ncbi:MAG: PLD nuclease N-terminal domain-containing protein [Chloroflexota bacterium]|nr:PLD nuclease N-terminal domain-containing protein [Chloroflexota bacterium]
MFGIIEALFILPFFAFFALSLAGMVLWIWMLVDCVTNEPSEGNDKVAWILIIALTGWIGALIYLVVRRPKRKEITGR